MKENQNDLYETADLGVAAFLVVKGCVLVSAGRSSGRFCLVFTDAAECKKLSVKYVNSEFSRFDAALKNLKNLVK